MSQLHTILKQLIENPKLWFAPILAAILAAHAVAKIIELIRDLLRPDLKKRHPRAKDIQVLIPALELMMCIGLLILCFEQTVEKSLSSEQTFRPWYEEPIAMVALLIFFGLSSIILMMLHHGREIELPTQSNPRQRPKKKKKKRQN